MTRDKQEDTSKKEGVNKQDDTSKKEDMSKKEYTSKQEDMNQQDDKNNHEPDFAKDIELYACGDEVKTVNGLVRLQILHCLKGESKTTFSNIQELTGLSKSTVSSYLNSLTESKLIACEADPSDSRKKLYYLSAKYLGKIDSKTDTTHNEYREIIRQTYANYDRIDYKLIMPHIFRVALAEAGIHLDPVLMRGGVILGESIAPYLVSDSLEKTFENIRDFWKQYGLGEVSLVSTDPVTLDIHRCYECMTLPKGIEGGCIISKGVLYALFTAFYHSDINIIEPICMTNGDSFCRYKIWKKE